MKKFITFILISLLLFSNTFAYDLTEKDKQNLEIINQKIEKIIFQKWEDFRNKVLDNIDNLILTNSLNDKIKSSLSYISLKLKQKNRFIKIENNNVILYEKFKRLKNITIDWDWEDWTFCENVSIFDASKYSDSQLKYSNYKIIFDTNNFSIVNNVSWLCLAGETNYDFIFDKNSGEYKTLLPLINEKVWIDFDYYQLWYQDFSLKIEWDKIIINSDFLYRWDPFASWEVCNLTNPLDIHSMKCEYVENYTTITKEQIDRYNINIIEDATKDWLWKLEIKLDYKDLFN